MNTRESEPTASGHAAEAVEAPATPYERLGGAAGIQRLVHRFYALMDELPEAYTVRRMHPEDLKSSEENLFDFLSGWFGGPSLFIEKKGHPRLRMRHSPYAVGLAQRDEWMLCMTQALLDEHRLRSRCPYVSATTPAHHVARITGWRAPVA